MKAAIKFFMYSFLLFTSHLHADIKTELVSINSSIVELNSSIASATITAENMCAPLLALNSQAVSIVDAITLSNANMVSPITLDEETLVLIQGLFQNLASVSGTSLLLSNDITAQVPATDALVLGDAIASMLQLSSDIGEMANRIGEMADNILIMADNIGLMADRIIETQTIQSENLILTQNSILATQTNTLAIVSVIETESYGLSLETLVANGNALLLEMSQVFLTPLNMATRFSEIKIDVNSYLAQVKAFESSLSIDSMSSTMYVNSDSLDALTDLSLIMSSIGTVMQGYNVSISSLEGITSDVILMDAMDSMLHLSADILEMSNSILEMADLILVMSDNIGLQANSILSVQELQNVNILATQTSVLASQVLAINLISTYN